MVKRVLEFLKRETVLSVAWGAAILSAFWVKPSMQYLNYIDWRTLGILWSLMAIVQGLKSNYVFDKMGWVLLGRTKKVWQLTVVLVMLCFLSSMLITNDVALITFVPFAVMMLKKCRHEELMIPVVVLQTVAANLGSMLTPIGNPQNLYLYGLSGLSFGAFIQCMLPYTVLAALLLGISLMLFKGKAEPIKMMELIMNEKGEALRASEAGKVQIPSEDERLVSVRTAGKRIMGYLLLFLLAILTVLHVVPFVALVLAVFLSVVIMERRILLKIDYTLLLTFIGFFIFTGNMGEISVFKEMLSVVVSGHEVLAGVLISQCISNVPAALLLSGFTKKYTALLVGVNLGGLGTLIASMASLISYKIFANEYKTQKKNYLAFFTFVNVVYLIIFGIFSTFI